MPPKIPCPNCGWSEWDGGKPGHVPMAVWNGDTAAVDVTKGFTVIPWKCANCHYVMLFWEPDTNRES